MKGSTDGRYTAIAIMTTVGGGIALLVSLSNLIAAFGLCVTIVGAVYSLVVGILCLIKGITLLSNPPGTQTAPFATAILQIVSLISCDIVNLVLGIVTLVMLSDPEAKSLFRD